MKEVEQLLQKFWDGQITLIELKKLYRLLPVYKDQLGADARINFTNVHEEIERKITAAKSAYLLDKIHNQLGIEKTAKIIKPWFKAASKAAVAAAVIAITTLTAVWLMSKNKIFPKEIARLEKSALPPLQSFVNNNATSKILRLEDSSVVELMSGSAITYYKPFIDNRRDISLKGTAFFKVAKDKARPFTVYANGISTTALGTQFWVFANNPDSTGVRLLEGKVVIKAVEKHGALVEDVYLVPGQNFSFDKLSRNVVVSKNVEEKQSGRAVVRNARVLNAKAMVFNNEPLENVLQKIQQAYKKTLVFHKADVKGLVFTGTFLPTDDIQIVLSALCNMNELSFENTGSGIAISKRK